MTVYPVIIRGDRRWRIDYTAGGVRRQVTYRTRAEAITAADDIGAAVDDGAHVLAAMSPADRADALLVMSAIAAHGLTLRAVWDRYRASDVSPAPGSVTLGQAVAALCEAKAASGRSPRYTETLRILLAHFAAGRESQLVADVTAGDVEAFLGGRPLRSRPTYRARLSTLFRFAIRRGYRPDNPCDRIEAVRLPEAPVAIMTPSEMARAVRWLAAERPNALGWYIMACGVGLRPEEAERTPWGAVDFAEGSVRVEAQTTKVRQRRVVYPRPEAMTWLRAARDAGGRLPLDRTARRRALRGLREHLGWPKWPKDITRHTAASYWLAIERDAAEVAEQLGHDVRTLRRHYLAVVTREQAAEYWSMDVAGLIAGRSSE